MRHMWRISAEETKTANLLTAYLLDYIAPLRMGDVMEVELTMSRRGAKFLFNQAIFRAADHSPVLRAVITIACLEGGRISRGDRLAEKFADYLTDSEQ